MDITVITRNRTRPAKIENGYFIFPQDNTTLKILDHKTDDVGEVYELDCKDYNRLRPSPLDGIYWLYKEGSMECYYSGWGQTTITICEKKRFLNFIISKNACSSIRYNSLILDNHLQQNQNYGDIWAYKQLINYMFHKDVDQLIFRNYRKFIIIRNPIERFVSILNHILDISKGVHIGSPYILRNGIEVRLVMEQAIMLARLLNMNKQYQIGDQHFLTQYSAIYEVDNDNIDDVVNIKYLNQYMQNIYDVQFQSINITKANQFSIKSFSNYDIERINSIYAKDYQMIKDLETKFYIP